MSSTMYLDIETVPQGWRDYPEALSVPPPHALMEAEQAAESKSPPKNYGAEAAERWRVKQLVSLESDAIKRYRNYALDPKLGEVVCICVAFDDGPVLTFMGEKEEDTLSDLHESLTTCRPTIIVAQNGLGFDYPYIWERAVSRELFELCRWFHAVPYGMRQELGIPYTPAVLADSKRLWQTTKRIGMGEWMAANSAQSISDSQRICDDLDIVDTISGATVLDALLAGDEEAVRVHCQTDVERMRRIWVQRLAPALGIGV